MSGAAKRVGANGAGADDFCSVAAGDRLMLYANTLTNRVQHSALRSRSGGNVGKLIKEFIIPAREARAFIVPKGQVLRIHLVESRQVGDCVFYNADDYKEM